MNLQISVAQQPDGSLVPNPFGEGVAIVNMTDDPTQPKTAIIMFAGLNQAVVNFDDTGRQVINYTLFNPAADIATQVTVENLIHHISSLQQHAALLH